MREGVRGVVGMPGVRGAKVGVGGRVWVERTSLDQSEGGPGRCDSLVQYNVYVCLWHVL